MKLVILTIFLSGCSALFVPQELSENYATMTGVECDAYEAVDGDLNTISDSTRIVISLPEKKSIRKIVIHNLNISNFIIYEYLGNEGQWRVIKSAKGNTQPRIEINTQVTTDKIRLFVSDTSGVSFVRPGIERDKDGFTHRVDAQVDARPQIQEIELYGLIDMPGKAKSKEPIF